MTRISLLRRILVSLFLLFNVMAVIRSNAPYQWTVKTHHWVYASPWSGLRWLGSKSDAVLGRYAYLTGVCLIAQMFTNASNYEMITRIWAVSSSGRRFLLPFPTQSRRTWLQSVFVDTKDHKFLANLYGGPPLEGRRLFAAYLCKEYKTPKDPIERILFVQETRMIPPQNSASLLGTTHRDPISAFTLADIPCSQKT